jgi:predicted RNA-binding protein associated with RNAse of E/G family
MKKIFVILILSSFVLSCHTSKKIAKHNNNNTSVMSEKLGSSYENAVFIEEKTEQVGVNAEYQWLNKNYPGYKMKGQSLNFHNDKPYDILHIVTADGLEKDIYFDISGFYGKF